MRIILNTGKKIILTLFFILSISPLYSSTQQTLSDRERDTFSQAVKELKNGSYDAALNLFNILLQIRIETYGLSTVPVANVLTNLGVTKSQLGLYDQAIEYYKKLLEIDSCHAPAAINCATLLKKNKKFDEAVEVITPSSELYEQNFILKYNLALCYLEMNKPE